MTRKFFTEEQEAAVVARYVAGETTTEIAASFNISNIPILRALQKAGVVTRQKSTSDRLTEDVRTEIAALCTNGMKIDDVAAKFKIGSRTVKKIIAKRGVTMKRGRPATCELDHTAFDDMTKPEAAYVTGFLFADGSVVHDDYGSSLVEVGLSVKDIGHVEKIRTFLKSTHKICIIDGHVGKQDRFLKGYLLKSGPSANLHVRSERLTNALIQAGMVPVKADRIPAPGLADDKHFWRGMIDGDGSLGIQRKGKHKGSVYISLNGQYVIIESFLAYLRRQKIDINQRPYHRSTIFCMNATDRIAIDIVRLLYENAPISLDRKQLRAVEILGKEQPTKVNT